MGLGLWWSKSVVLIAGAEEVGATPNDARLCGTGFIVMIPSADLGIGFSYLVTAAHVVRSFGSTFIKLSRKDGSVADLPVPAWAFHPSEDVAVGAFQKDSDDYDHYFVRISEFIEDDEEIWDPMPGDDIFFAGLLGQVPSMGSRNVPMVRKGSIGALDQEGIPMRMPGNTLIRVRGHLVDCQSFGGFSGSPCFARYVTGIRRTEHMGLGEEVQSTLLLGMLGGHFDQTASVSLPDQEQQLDIPVAAGVAVVYPASVIRETLNLDFLAAERDQFNIRVEGRRALDS